MKDEEKTIEDALLNHYEITVLTKQLLKQICERWNIKPLHDLLNNEKQLKQYIQHHDLLDLVRDFSIKEISPQDFIPLLRKMPARLYSIASSWKANPDEVHLTIGAVRYHAGGRDRKGVCSVYCAER